MKLVRRTASAVTFYSLISVALVGPLFCQAASMTAALLQGGYNLLRDAVSSLVFGPYGWLQTIVFLIFGISVLCLDVALLTRYKVKNIAGPILIGLVGVGFFIIGLNHGQVPGGPMTASIRIHNYTTAGIIFLFPAACFCLAPTFKALRYRYLHWGSIGLGIAMALFLVVGGYVLALKSSMVGMYERILLGAGQLWVMAIGLHILLDKRLRPALVTNSSGLIPIEPGHEWS